MAIKYYEAEDIRKIAQDVVQRLEWIHVKIEDVGFLRSRGSSAKGTIARCHALSVPMQIGLKRKGFYLIEVISERFDKLSEQEKIKVIIHELMHIPKTFGGGFIHHHMVNERAVKKIYEQYIDLKESENEQEKKWF